MPILAILYTTHPGGGTLWPFYTQSHGGRPTKHKRGLVPRMQGDGFASERSGIMEVAMWLCASLLVDL